MIKLKRLNLDSSWHIHFNRLKFILDPWLIGSEIDGFKQKLFNIIYMESLQDTIVQN